jgi:uncharacterized protein YllA (UPF0747 family)
MTQRVRVLRDDALDEAVIGIDARRIHEGLYADFVSGRYGGLGGRGSTFGDLAEWKARAAEKLSKCRATRPMWREIEELNRRLGAAAPAVENVEALAAGRAVAVVGGQQPGLMGGPLLVIYKAATAIAMAERFREATGVACAPVFIVSSDDSDFDEIKRCTIFDRLLRRLSLEYPADDYTPGQVVGSLSADTEKGLAGSLAELVGGGSATGRTAGHGGSPARGNEAGGARPSEFIEGVLSSAAGAARDHGDFVAAILSALFSEHGLVLIDGRSPEMRRAGGELFKSYVDRREELRDAVSDAGEEMARRGYHAQIGDASLEWWLFLTDAGIRRKVGESALEEIKRAADSAPETLSPNVALRPIWRDSVLPAVYCVCGPGEVAYSLQLARAYDLLGVRQPGLLPRLGVTLLPVEAVEMAGGWTEEALVALHVDFEGTLRAHFRERAPREALEALERARSGVAGILDDLEGSLAGISQEWRSAAESVKRSAGKGLDKLENDIVDAVKREVQGRNPRLKGLGEFLLPDGRMQERVLSALAPFLDEGESFVERVIGMARTHVGALESGDVRHYCCRIGRTGDA